MAKSHTRTLLPLLGALLLSGAAPAAGSARPPARRPELKRMTARFAPVDIKVDVSKLPDAEQRALAKLVQAAKLMDPLFLRQVWAGNEALLLDLLQDTTPLGRARLHAFLLNKGPWSRLDEATAVPPRRAGQAGRRATSTRRAPPRRRSRRG